MKNKVKLNGMFTLQHVRDSKIIKEMKFHNGITYEGFLKLLDVMFHGDTAITAWYVGLIADGTITFSPADTMTSHAGWSEVNAAKISQSTRPEWEPDAAEVVSDVPEITNTTVVEFDFVDSQAVYGVFIASDNVLGGTDGVLWDTAAFDSVINAVNGDKIRLTYSVTVSE